MFLKGLHENVDSSRPCVSQKIGSGTGMPSRDILNMSFSAGNASGFGTVSSLAAMNNTEHLHQVARPRMRICFDPETEIPRLQKWFSESNHPTRQQVNVITNVINIS